MVPGLPGLFVGIHQPLGDRLQRADQLALFGIGIEQHLHHPLNLKFVVVVLAVELGLEIEDQLGIGCLG